MLKNDGALPVDFGKVALLCVCVCAWACVCVRACVGVCVSLYVYVWGVHESLIAAHPSPRRSTPSPSSAPMAAREPLFGAVAAAQ